MLHTRAICEIDSRTSRPKHRNGDYAGAHFAQTFPWTRRTLRMQKKHRPESMPSEANTISILRPKKEERRAKRSLLILFGPQVFIPRRDV